MTSKVLLPIDDSGLVGHKIFELQEVKLCGAVFVNKSPTKSPTFPKKMSTDYQNHQTDQNDHVLGTPKKCWERHGTDEDCKT